MAIGGGIEKKGKTKGKQLGIDGAKVPVQQGGKGGAARSVTNENRKKYGRNISRIKNQTGG